MSSPVASLTAEQREIRKTGIGASEIAAVAGLDPYRNALDVFLDKTGQSPPFEGNEFTKWGNRLEAVIADEYAERLGVMVRSPGATLRHPLEPWMLATPDRFVLTDDPNEGWLLQCKARDARLAARWGESGTDEVPHDTAAQCHWEMAVAGFKRCDVAVLIGGNDFRVYTLTFDQEILDGLIAMGRKFWHEHVLANVHPPLDGSESAHRFVFKKYPMHSDEMVTATPEIDNLCVRLAGHRSAIEEHEAAKSAIEVQLKDFIGARMGVLTSSGKVTWKYVAETEVKAHTKKAHRRLLAQFSSKQSS